MVTFPVQEFKQGHGTQGLLSLYFVQGVWQQVRGTGYKLLQVISCKLVFTSMSIGLLSAAKDFIASSIGR